MQQAMAASMASLQQGHSRQPQAGAAVPMTASCEEAQLQQAIAASLAPPPASGSLLDHGRFARAPPPVAPPPVARPLRGSGMSKDAPVELSSDDEEDRSGVLRGLPQYPSARPSRRQHPLLPQRPAPPPWRARGTQLGSARARTAARMRRRRAWRRRRRGWRVSRIRCARRGWLGSHESCPAHTTLQGAGGLNSEGRSDPWGLGLFTFWQI